MTRAVPLLAALVIGALAIAFGRRAFLASREGSTPLHLPRLLTLSALTGTAALKLALGPLVRWWLALVVFAALRVGLSLLVTHLARRPPQAELAKRSRQ
ncbi:MAG: hypothetical protein MUC96_11260 [Myxococcaceae bacterium]|jgi:hypothetical protein|nr:hypothetical protein [Myxococcaceae bacterium]